MVYVDDILLTGNNLSFIADLKNALHEAFSIKYLGEAKYYLGLEVSRTEEEIVLSQKKFILEFNSMLLQFNNELKNFVWA